MPSNISFMYNSILLFSENTSIVLRREHKEAVEALTELKIWKESSATGGLAVWELNPIFKKHVRVALLGGLV